MKKGQIQIILAVAVLIIIGAVVILIIVGMFRGFHTNILPEKQSGSEISAQEEAWTKFEPEDKKFSVLFPGKIQPEKTVYVDGVSATSYSSETTGGQAYGVGVLTLVKREPGVLWKEFNTKELFEIYKDQAKERGKDYGLTLTKEENTTFQGYEATDFIMENDELYMESKLIKADNYVYQLTVGGELKSYNKSTHNKFVNSFKILSP